MSSHKNVSPSVEGAMGTGRAKGMRPITAPAPRSANARLVKRKPKDEAGRPVTAPVKELLLSNEGNSLSPDEILQRKKSAPIEIKEIRN